MTTASALLLAHWRAGTRIAELPPVLIPPTEEEAYALQVSWEGEGATSLFGWKIAATSSAGQAHIGVSGPLAGRLNRERVLPDGGTYTLGTSLMRVAELEFAFRFAKSLPPRETAYSVDEVLEHVGTLHPAIEIPDTRLELFEKVGAMQLIADNACADAFVLGPQANSGWRSLDLAAHQLCGTVNDTEVHHGHGANALGDPRIALTWLANRLSELGITLQAGQVVTTGVCTIPIPVAPGDRLYGDFGILGQVSVQFA